jgi:hypothetical protein
VLDRYYIRDGIDLKKHDVRAVVKRTADHAAAEPVKRIFSA